MDSPRLALPLLAALLVAGPVHAEDKASTSKETTGATAPETPATDRFGGPPADAAYGAFQRGLYMTALNLAMPRAEAGDSAAQTLVAEILSRGLGVKRDEAKAAKWYQPPPSRACPRRSSSMR